MTILCYGEALWDCLPAGLFMGGAPLNVAYHLGQLGQPACLVSAIGQDQLGEELRRRADRLGIDHSLLASLDGPATGTVQVELEHGKPSYTITQGVAWDQITVDAAVLSAAAGAQALVFGSLAQRSPFNRLGLSQLRKALDPSALVVFDINLRQPYDDLDLVRELAVGVDCLKLNDEEAARLLNLPVDECPPEAAARQLAEQLQMPMVALTAGAQGAGLWKDGQWHWAEAQPITVVDTVGAGDSFMAALLDGLLRQKTPAAALEAASRLAEFVAASHGPTPDHRQRGKS